MPIKIDYSMGLAIYLQNCSFMAEISRNGIPDVVANIDLELSTMGIPAHDTMTRISSVMQSITAYADAVSMGDIDQETAVSEIAYGFVYSYVKQKGMDELSDMRGLIGCLAEGKLYLNPCPDTDSYNEAVKAMNETTDMVWNQSDIPMIDQTPPKPTIH